MKKLFLIISILLCATFIYLKIESLGNSNNSFNQTTRFKLGHYQIIRTILGLHNDGDARAWFIEGDKPLIVEVVQAQNASLNEDALNSFVEKVKKYANRPVSVVNDDTIKSGTLTDEDLSNIVSQHRRHVLFGQPNLFVIYAGDFTRTSKEVGETYKDYGIVLSDARLKEITQEFPDSLKDYQESTLLHEFGHQIGLDHNDQNNCIMNSKVEQPELAGEFSGTYTPTDFCDYEIEQISNIKANLY